MLDDHIEMTDKIIFDLNSSGLHHEEDCMTFTRFTSEQLNELQENYLKSMNDTKRRSKTTALAVYLTKLKTGMTCCQISRLMKMSVRQVEVAIMRVRDELYNNLVIPEFGINNITRDVSKEHMSKLVMSLHCESDDQIATIWDGTYSYIQKSYDNSLQRSTYSVQKSRSLVKPFVAIAADGYIIDIFGLFSAKDNDATIMKSVIEKNRRKFKDIFKDGDVFIVDRGLRVCKSILKQMNYRVAMLAYIPPKEKQMTTKQGNQTRMITKCRYKVKVVNGNIKQFRFLDQVRPNS